MSCGACTTPDGKHAVPCSCPCHAPGPSDQPFELASDGAFLKKLQDRTTRFNELLNGPLYHPLMPFVITRLQHALLAVVLSSDDAWTALERHCADREKRDGETAV